LNLGNLKTMAAKIKDNLPPNENIQAGDVTENETQNLRFAIKENVSEDLDFDSKKLNIIYLFRRGFAWRTSPKPASDATSLWTNPDWELETSHMYMCCLRVLTAYQNRS